MTEGERKRGEKERERERKRERERGGDRGGGERVFKYEKWVNSLHCKGYSLVTKTFPIQGNRAPIRL